MMKLLFILSGLSSIILISPYGKNFFFEEGFRWLYVLSFSTSLSFFLTPVMRLMALRFEILDFPNERKIHTEPTPLLGGVAVYTAVVVALISNNIMDKQT